MKNKKQKILVAMSGGVDSSVVAALLVGEGYDVTGAYMINYDDNELSILSSSSFFLPFFIFSSLYCIFSSSSYVFIFWWCFFVVVVCWWYLLLSP